MTSIFSDRAREAARRKWPPALLLALVPAMLALPAAQAMPPQARQAPPAFEVAERYTLDFPSLRRVVYEVIVQAEAPEEAHLRTIARAVWEEGGASWAPVHVRMYLPGMDRSASAYAVAIFGPSRGELRSLHVNPGAARQAMDRSPAAPPGRS